MDLSLKSLEGGWALLVFPHLLGWPFPPSASASFFTAFSAKGFPQESLQKTLITQFSAFNSRKMSFRMLTFFFCTRLPPPNSLLKPPGRCPISAFHFSRKVASHRSGRNHCGNFRSSAPQPPRSVNGHPCSLEGLFCHGRRVNTCRIRGDFLTYMYLPITSFDGPLLGFKKSRSRGKDEKLRHEKAKMRKKTKH